MNSSLHSNALDAEEEGDRKKAATNYIGLASYLVAKSDYRNSRTYREGVTYALLAISHDIIAGNPTRAERHFALFQEAFEQIATTEDKVIVRGIGHEWLGDARLMVGEDGVCESYETARKLFEDLELDAQLLWGAVPEYDTAYRAASQFFEFHECGYYREHDIEFAARVEWKRETAKQLRT